MTSPPSPQNPPIVVRPHDVFDCRGCGQRLHFDECGFVPLDQLEACRGLCDWVLVERDRCPTAAEPASATAASHRADPAERFRDG